KLYFRRPGRFYGDWIAFEIPGFDSCAIHQGMQRLWEAHGLVCAEAPSGNGGEAAASGTFCGRAGASARPNRRARRIRAVAWALVLCLPAVVAGGAKAQSASAARLEAEKTQHMGVPPRVREAERFLMARGWASQSRTSESELPYSSPLDSSLAGYRAFSAARNPAIEMAPATARLRAARASARMEGDPAQSPPSTTWQPLGPSGVLTSNFGLVTGRISSLTLDPSDATGDRLYVGTTGGGVWEAQNAAADTASSIVFTP